MLQKTVEDVSVETTGNFDYPKTKAGGLDALLCLSIFHQVTRRLERRGSLPIYHVTDS